MWKMLTEEGDIILDIQDNREKPLVSIIIPVYNVENFLSQCLNSVICQTLHNIEIILVNDGSTDNSGRICDEYVSNDNRIHVIHKIRNEGLSNARNDGVRASTASYILFVDSDDWIEPVCCEYVYKIAKENNADCVLFLYYINTSDGEIEQKRMKLKEGLLNEEEALSFNIHYSCAAWLGLYQRELIECIPFPSGKFYEDIATTHKLIHRANRIWLFNEPLYHHRVDRLNSITTAPETKTHPDKKEMLNKKINDLNYWGYDGFVKWCSFSYLKNYGCLETANRGFVDCLLKNDRIPAEFGWKKRIMVIVLKASPFLFDFICVIMKKRVK